MALQTSAAVTPSLAVVRLLQDYGRKSLPVGFVAYKLGLQDSVVRQHIDALAKEKVVKLGSDDSVSMF